jgi:hypothetical protein
MVGFGCPAVAYLIVSIRTFRRERDTSHSFSISGIESKVQCPSPERQLLRYLRCLLFKKTLN